MACVGCRHVLDGAKGRAVGSLVGSLRAFHSPRIASERLAEMLGDRCDAHADSSDGTPELLGGDAPLLGPVFHFPGFVDVDLRPVGLTAKVEIIRHYRLLSGVG